MLSFTRRTLTINFNLPHHDGGRESLVLFTRGGGNVKFDIKPRLQADRGPYRKVYK